MAFGTKVIIGPPKTKLVVLKVGAEARSETRQHGSGLAREKGFVRIYERRAAVQNPIWALGVDGVAHDVGMYFTYRLLIGTCWDNPVLQIWLDDREAFRTKRMLHLTMVWLRS